MNLPDIFVIQLARFHYLGAGGVVKVETKVHVPVNGLDAADFLEGAERGEHVFDLFAVVNHYGATPRTGLWLFTVFCIVAYTSTCVCVRCRPLLRAGITCSS